MLHPRALSSSKLTWIWHHFKVYILPSCLVCKQKTTNKQTNKHLPSCPTMPGT